MSRLMIIVVRTLGIASALLVGACAQTPVAELDAYSQAYAQARIAGDLLLDEVSAIEDVQKATDTEPSETCEIDANTGYRNCFTVALALGSEATRRNEVIDIKVRRLALAQIAAYNQLLGDLAQGRSASALNDRIDSLQSLTGSVVGFAGSVSTLGGLTAASKFVDLARPLIAKIETMRANNAAARSILAAEQDIRNLVRLLIDDTPTMYDLFVQDYREKVQLAKIELSLAKTAEDRERFTSLVANLTDPQSSENAARAFEKALVAYVKLLDSSDKALFALAKAIREPMEDPIAAASLFASQATEMRMLSDEFLSRIRVLRNPSS